MDTAQLINSEVHPVESPVHSNPGMGYPQEAKGYVGHELPVMSSTALPAGKYYVKHDSLCLSCCQRIDVRQSWDSEPLITIRTTWLDMILNRICCRMRQSVEGAAGGHVQYYLHSRQYRGKTLGAVAVNDYVPPFYNAIRTKNWQFLTTPSSVDFFVADTATGAELLGIRKDHLYDAHKIFCCNFSCAPCKLFCHGCCRKTNISRRAVVRGPRMQGGQPVGTMQTGFVSSWCGLCTEVGGVLETPQMSSLEELLPWVLLWDISHFYFDEHTNAAWSEPVPLKNIEEMV